MNLENGKLVEISAELEKSFRELAKEGIQAKETPYINWNGDFEDYLKRTQVLAKAENLPVNCVRSHTYLLMCGEKVIGRSEIRRELTPDLGIYGHISADIRRSERKKGFGTMISKLSLEKARELGLEEVLLTCKKSNIASVKLIEKHGGIFDREIIYGKPQNDIFTLLG